MRIVAMSGRAQKYNGGTKLYNLWVKLLREHGYEAYIATVDGQYDRWLVNHQPVISYDEVNQLRTQGYDVRMLTGWLDTPQFERIVDDGQFYCFDAELKWTLHFRKNLDYFLERDMIAGIGTHSRYIQSWYMAEYGIKPILINEWSDTTIFYPKPEVRVPGRIGCMVESLEDEKIYEFLRLKCLESDLCESIIKIEGGDEQYLADTMQTVDIFAGLNQGKHPLWGEGCPRTQQEAMHCGCVLVAFDVSGNREYLYNDWTGLLVTPGDADGLWNAIEFLLENEPEKERLRANGMNLVGALFTENGKFDLVSSVLGLNGMSNEELTTIFPKPFWLNRQEIPYLAKCAASARSTIVEIGCAYGGSTVVFLLNKTPSAHVCSIDPFVPDTQGSFLASEKECRYAVEKAVEQVKRPELLRDWTLTNGYSHEVVKQWDKEIDLLFIDGSHLYEDVKRDFEQWSRFLAPDGRILLHDSRKDNLENDPDDKVFSRGWSGPTRLADELRRSEDFEVEDVCYSITVFARKRASKKEGEL
jgi:SAM-dependent methyltransferase